MLYSSLYFPDTKKTYKSLRISPSQGTIPTLLVLKVRDEHETRQKSHISIVNNYSIELHNDEILKRHELKYWPPFKAHLRRLEKR